MKENWKHIKDFENYMISNFGRVKKLYKHKEKILKPCKENGGYFQIHLTNNENKKSLRIHLLVWDAFGSSPRNGRILQVDHIDNNKENNNIENLQLLNQRENIKKMYLTKEKTSKYSGVCWSDDLKKWRANICFNKHQYYLGLFDTEKEAKEKYDYALNNKEEIINRPTKKKTSKYTGVYWVNKDQKWFAHIKINKKNYHLGSFDSEEKANEVYQYALNNKNEIVNKIKKETTSKYKGIHKQGNKWILTIKGKYIGSFNSEEEANNFKNNTI